MLFRSRVGPRMTAEGRIVRRAASLPAELRLGRATSQVESRANTPIARVASGKCERVRRASRLRRANAVDALRSAKELLQRALDPLVLQLALLGMTIAPPPPSARAMAGSSLVFTAAVCAPVGAP